MERVQYWWLTHPRWSRPLLIMSVLHVLMLCSLATAPGAVAAGNGAVLNFTGLRDSYGVPIGDYYLTLASATEQLRDGGPPVDSLGGVMEWLRHAAQVATTSQFAAAILDFQCGAFVAIIALALWIMKALMAGYWLTLIGSIAQAVTTAVIGVFTKVGVVMIAVPVGVWLGLMRIRRGDTGAGWMTVLAGLGLPALTVTVFNDPAGLMYGRNGILDFGRQVGFSVAQTVHPGGLYSGTDFGGRIDTMTASLVTHAVREPIQLWNFGHVIDANPACAAAWSGAIRSGIKEAPLAAVHRCGDSSAAAYALHLDGTNIWVGGVFILVALLLGYVLAVCGWCVLKVLVKALWATATIVVVLWMGAIFARRALDTVWAFFRHGIEIMVYVIYASVVGMAIETVASRPLPAELGGVGVFPRVLLLGLVALIAIMLLHHLHYELTGRPHATVRALNRVGSVAAGMAIHSAISGGTGAAAAGMKQLSHSSVSQPPGQHVDDPAAILGAPSHGFEPIPGRGGGITAPTSSERASVVPAVVSGIPTAGTTASIAAPATGRQWLTEAEHSDMLAAEARQELARTASSDSGEFEPIGTENRVMPQNMSGASLDPQTSADGVNPQVVNEDPLGEPPPTVMP